MINKPKIRPSNNTESDEEIQKAKQIIYLLMNPPKDKAFNKNYEKYFISFYELINYMESNIYSDEVLKAKINVLYEKMMKNRRH